MPTTTAEHNRSLITPGIYSLLPIRDFLPGALTPADGSWSEPMDATSQASISAAR